LWKLFRQLANGSSQHVQTHLLCPPPQDVYQHQPTARLNFASTLLFSSLRSRLESAIVLGWNLSVLQRQVNFSPHTPPLQSGMCHHKAILRCGAKHPILGKSHFHKTCSGKGCKKRGPFLGNFEGSCGECEKCRARKANIVALRERGTALEHPNAEVTSSEKCLATMRRLMKIRG
jgi:hypothetical protein